MRRGLAAIILCSVIVAGSCVSKDGGQIAATPSFDSVISRADKVYDSGYKEKALALVISEYQRAKDLTVADQMNYYTYCGEVYRKDLRNDDKYSAYADSIIQTIEKNGLEKKLSARYIQAFNMKADALFSKGLYNESYDYYYRAKKLAGDNEDSCSLSQFSYSLGMVQYRQQKFVEAAGDFMTAFNETGSCKDLFIFFYRKQEILDNIGLCFYHAGRYDSAMVYYKKALAYIDSNSHRFDKQESVFLSAKAVVCGNMADLYMILNERDTAEALLKKSINVNLQKGYTNSDALTDQVKLCGLYYGEGNMSRMRDVLTDIRAELDTIPDRQVEMSMNKLMWQYYESQKRPDSAYHYLKAYVLMNDSFATRNKLLLASDVEGRIRSMERQYQIKQLKENTDQEKMYLLVACLVALMAIVIIVMVLRNMRRSRTNVETLTALNQQVNEQKEKLQAALTELEVKDVDKSRVLRAAAHDLLNPIAAISGLADILNFDSDNMTGEQREIIGLIKESCNNSVSLAKDILEVASASDRKNLNKEWLDINKLVASSIDLMSTRAAKKKQQLRFSHSSSDIHAFVSKEKIWRVINNLIGNAIKFSYENASIEIGLRVHAGMVEISVTDHGTGIPEKNKPFVFNVFSEAKMPGTSGEVPHGLGLSISQQIMKAHDGSIWFESEEGKGSVFHIAFPVGAPGAAAVKK